MMRLIQTIYKSLSNLISGDPSYKHQYAKCYIRSSQFEKNPDKQIELLTLAFRQASIAERIFEERYNFSHNEKLEISLAHVIYTQSLIMCQKCAIHGYADVSQNTDAIEKLYQAMKSPYNDFEFVQKDSFNRKRWLQEIVKRAISDKTLVHESVHKHLEELFALFRSELRQERLFPKKRKPR